MELALRHIAKGRRFWKENWCVFDFTVSLLLRDAECCQNFSVWPKLHFGHHWLILLAEGVAKGFQCYDLEKNGLLFCLLHRFFAQVISLSVMLYVIRQLLPTMTASANSDAHLAVGINFPAYALWPNR